jgi:hypothetical protein
MTVDEMKERLENEPEIFGAQLNPFTGNPLTIEDSPGNYTAVREDGKIVDLNLYWRDGTPISYRKELRF